MTIHDTLDYIQESFSSIESMYHWLFWLHATNYHGLSSDLLLEEAAYHCLDDKQWFLAMKYFTLLFGVEYWKVDECVRLHILLHKDVTYPIWSQGQKYFIQELDEIPSYNWMADDDLPF